MSFVQPEQEIEEETAPQPQEDQFKGYECQFCGSKNGRKTHAKIVDTLNWQRNPEVHREPTYNITWFKYVLDPYEKNPEEFGPYCSVECQRMGKKKNGHE